MGAGRACGALAFELSEQGVLVIDALAVGLVTSAKDTVITCSSARGGLYLAAPQDVVATGDSVGKVYFWMICGCGFPSLRGG